MPWTLALYFGLFSLRIALEHLFVVIFFFTEVEIFRSHFSFMGAVWALGITDKAVIPAER